MRMSAPSISRTRLEQLLSLNAQSKPISSQPVLKSPEAENASVDRAQSTDSPSIR